MGFGEAAPRPQIGKEGRSGEADFVWKEGVSLYIFPQSLSLHLYKGDRSPPLLALDPAIWPLRTKEKDT